MMNNKTRLVILALLLTIGLLFSYLLYSHLIVNLSYSIDNLMVTRKLYCTYKSFDIFSEEKFNNSKCHTLLDLESQEIYSYKHYYKVEPIYIMPSILQTLISTVKIILCNPAVFILVMIMLIIIELFSTGLGNIIFILILGFVCFVTILLILFKMNKELFKEKHEELILDLENNEPSVELESKI